MGASQNGIRRIITMMMIKKAYFYLFYKFYRFTDWAHTVFPHDMAATAAIAILEMVFIVSLKFYYIEYINPKNELTPLQMIVLGIVVFLVNTIAFIMNDNWKHYFKEFDKLPRYKNIIGTWVVILIVAFILVSAGISFKAMSEIAAHRPK
jgi:hypothetical protein